MVNATGGCQVCRSSSSSTAPALCCFHKDHGALSVVQADQSQVAFPLLREADLLVCGANGSQEGSLEKALTVRDINFRPVGYPE